MTKQELHLILNELKEGKIFYSQDRTFAYSGDIRAEVIKYDNYADKVLWELYDLTPNGDFCTRSEEILLEKLSSFIDDDFETAMNQLHDKKLYPFVN